MNLSDPWKKHLFQIQGTIIIIIIFVVFYCDSLLGSVVISSTQMLQSLIQAEATVLGFFGIIAVYALTSYDSRIDRFEQQWFDLTLGGHTKIAEEVMEKRIKSIKNRKRRTSLGIGASSGFIILSLIFSMVLLGIKDTSNSKVVQTLAFSGLNAFFLGVIAIMFLFYQMSYEAQEL